MKYNLKTAVHVTDEFTRKHLIEFFEAIKGDCNEKYQWTIDNVRLNRVCYIDEYGYLEGWDIDNFKSRYPDYTILEGIPENWRDEMEIQQVQSDIIDNFNIQESEISGRLNGKLYLIHEEIKKHQKEIARLHTLKEEIQKGELSNDILGKCSMCGTENSHWDVSNNSWCCSFC